MDVSKEILSDITVYSKYARYDKNKKRRETWEEICERNMNMHIRKYPHMEIFIRDVYERSVIPKKILPSMRSMQFAGVPIERNPSRIYNCAYLPIEDSDAFSEIMFLLLGGTGVGYSVQRHHIERLPVVKGPNDNRRRYIIGDSIEGWADAVKVLVESYFYGKDGIEFDFSDIREKGAELVTSGGKAPGPEPLKAALVYIRRILAGATGRQLKPIEAHDIACHEADAVLAGGIRRAAMISLFSRDDDDMLHCKSGEWWNDNPQRSRANNSVVLVRGTVSYDNFANLWLSVRNSGAGEPGFYWTNNQDWGTNPCCEIALRPYQFCNLTEVNTATITDQRDFNQRASDAAFIGTLQAGYTDFNYLRPIWKRTTEEDALIGVGLTGIASGAIEGLDETEAAHVAVDTNIIVSSQLGINVASRVTTVKPSGTTSLVVGSSSGIHSWHSPYYIRRMRLGKNEAIAKYLMKNYPELVEDEVLKPDLQIVLSVPQAAPMNAMLRTESALDLLERVKRYNIKWVGIGHRKGDNHNNVSCTVSLRENEWDDVRDWMWDNQNVYNGISVLPYDGGTYRQTPFEDIDEDTFNELYKSLRYFDVTAIREESDTTNLAQEAACANGECEVSDLI